eukprot:15451053-Alexandrium_andersonii.AAC.1
MRPPPKGAQLVLRCGCALASGCHAERSVAAEPPQHRQQAHARAGRGVQVQEAHWLDALPIPILEGR